MAKKFFIALLCTTLVLQGSVASAATKKEKEVKGSDIYYASITARRGDTLRIHVASPAGDKDYSCTASGKCTSAGSNFLPKIEKTTTYETSSGGKYGVIPHATGLSGSYLIYDISGKKPKKVATLTTNGSVIKFGFSPNEEKFVTVTKAGQVNVFDISEAKLESAITISQTDLPFFSISANGGYLAAYNYVSGVHRIWNTKTGALVEIPGGPHLVEFSENEKSAAFIIEQNGFRNLGTIALPATGRINPTLAAAGNFLVEDYIYLGNDLYYLSNRKSPLDWSLYKLGNTNPVVSHASYGEYLTRVGDKIAYAKIVGKNSLIYLFDGRESIEMKAGKVSPAASNLSREEIKIAGRSAALIEPKDEPENANLIIWLHGGPQRQTSVEYHPYLSYAVYDEMLEKFASAGNYVLKLDYTGSWGYGNPFLNALDRNIGVKEIDDVENVIKEFTANHDVENVYLVGNSYGGYMALRALNESPNQIDGVASIAGVTNWFTLIKQIPSSPFARLFGGVPNGTNTQLYLNASVFTGTNKIKDQPIVLVYGTNDRTIPPSQSILYENYMKDHDKNVTATALQGEDHVIKKRASLNKMCSAIVSAFDLEGVSCK